MIRPSDSDDPHFIALANRLLNASLSANRPAEVYLIRLDSWFDAKWLNFSGKALGALGVHRDPITVPPFHPRRVVSQIHFALSPTTDAFEPAAVSPLHIDQPSGENLTRQISRVSPSAVFLR
jgi:hypothetical protein